MYSKNTFGSFYPVNSIIHRLNPVVKLINFLLIVILSLLTSSIYINGFVLSLVFIMILLSYVPFKYYFNTVWSLRYIYILIAFICAYFDISLNECIVYMFKLTSIVEYIHILCYTTSPSESAYAIEKVLSFFNIFNLRISIISFKLNNILRYLPLSNMVENKLLKTISSRGKDVYYTNIINRFFISLNIYSKKRRFIKYKNKQMDLEVSQRLFSINRYRTNYRTNKVGFYDIFFMLFHVSLILLYVKERGLL